MTRSNSGSKRKLEKLPSRYAMMRTKLTLRPRNSPSTSQVVKVETAEQEIAAHVKQRRQQVFQRGSPMKLVRLYPDISNKQEQLIRGAGYGGLLDIKCSKLQPELCKFLMDSFDPSSSRMIFPGRGSIPITERSVGKVMGIPRGPLEVRYALDADAVRFMSEQFGNNGRKQPTMTYLEEKLKGMKTANGTYLRIFIIYAMNAVLSPTTATRISPRVYPSLVNIEDANRLNMCRFVIGKIQKASKAGAKKVEKACMLYMMVKYLDSLLLDDMDIPQGGTRVSVWTNERVKKAISKDMRTDGSFGMAPLKPKFSEVIDQIASVGDVNGLARVELQQGGDGVPTADMEQGDDVAAEPEQGFIEPPQFMDTNDAAPLTEEQGKDFSRPSILFPDSGIIRNFIEAHTPADCSMEESARYKQAIEEACYGFESGLELLVRTLSHRQVTDQKEEANNSKNPDIQSKTETDGQHISPNTINSKELPQDEDESEDEEYIPGPDVVDQSQTTVSMDDESVNLWKIPEEDNPSCNDRLLRRRKRDIVRQEQAKCNSSNSVSKDKEDSSQNQTIGKESCTPTNAEPIALDVHHSPNDYVKSSSKEAAKSTSELLDNMTDVKKSIVDHSSIDGIQAEPVVNTEPSSVVNAISNISIEGKVTSEPKDSDMGKCEDLIQNIQKRSSHSEDIEDNKLTTVEVSDAENVLPQTPDGSLHEGIDANSDVEESYNLQNSRGRKKFFDFVKSSPAPKFDVPKLETPIIIDWEMEMPERKLMHELVPPDFDDMLVDGFSKLKMDNYVMEQMKLDKLPGKRKQDSFADDKKKRLKGELPMPDKDQPKSPSAIKTETAGRRTSPRLSARINSNTPATPMRETRASRLRDMSISQVAPHASPPHASDEQQNVTKAGAKTVCMQDSMNRKLEFESTESNIKRKQVRFAVDPPSFDLSTPPDEAEITANKKFTSVTHDGMVAVHKENEGTVVTGQAGCSKGNVDASLLAERRRELARSAPDAPTFDLCTPPDDTILPAHETDIHARTDLNAHGVVSEQAKDGSGVIGQEGCSNENDDPKNDSITPVHHEYQKRVTKPGKAIQPPFGDPESKNKYNITKPIIELYNLVCQHCRRRGVTANTNHVIDIDTFFICIADLADSVAPGKQLINVVCEIAIEMMISENKNPMKVIMPLRLAGYLIDFRHDQSDVIRCLSFNANDRLDHKELICFPTLQKFSRRPDEPSGHYWLVVLNLKAERFEILDSLGKKGSALMMDACHLLIGSIKYIWSMEYKDSKVQIANYPAEIIDSPRQTNTFDCGFFTLTNLEEWDGRRVPSFEQKDLPNIRKILTNRWLRFHTNKIEWKLVV